ncbi:MAG: FAD-binding oxidoreductase [Proteobacteria bacterium]|nr:FAD-binding oxidoreductase [Pseudomonadota bacterium]
MAEEHVRSYYAASANPARARAPLQGEISCDVCVIGAGFTGLTIALELAEKGFDVVVLESVRAGWGASGRNGGQICSGYSADMDRIAGWVGAVDARRLWSIAEEGKAIIEDRVARHGIACDLTSGYLYAADSPKHEAWLEPMVRDWAENYGYERARLIGRGELRDLVRSDRFLGGVLDEGGGHLHPLNYALGLADAAEAAGVRIFENSPVTEIDTGAAPWARTAEGAVRAKFLAIAANAYLGGVAPELRRHIMPVGTYIVATEPLGEEGAAEVLPTNLAVADLNFVISYFRLSADRRMLFGTGVSYSTVPPLNTAERYRRKMVSLFPQLADARIEYIWGGFVGISRERTPHLGRLSPTVYFAQGFSGHGVALTGIAGRVIAEAIAGQAERFDLFAKLPHTAFPGGRLLRTPLLVLAMTWIRLRELI